MMGAAMVKRKRKAQKTLAILKKAAVTIAIFDLILTISDCRCVGRFFLLVTMSTLFDTTPENVIGDHCTDNVRQGVCETYAQIMETGSVAFSSEMSGRSLHPSTKTTTSTSSTHHSANADTQPSSYLKATLSIQRLPEMLPEMFKELWKSTFDDPSRTDANISFYFDDEVPQMHEQQLLSPKHKNHAWHIHSSSSASVPSSSSLNNHQRHHSSPSSLIRDDGKDIQSLNQKRASAFGESHEYEQSHLNSHVREIDHDFLSEGSSISLSDVRSTFTTQTNDVTGTTGTKYDNSKPLHNQHFSKNQEIGSNRKKRFAQQPLQHPPQQSIESGEKDWKHSSPISQSNKAAVTETLTTFTTIDEEDLRRPTVSSSTLKTTPEKGTGNLEFESNATRKTSAHYSSDHLKPTKSNVFLGPKGGKYNGSSRVSNLFFGRLEPKESAKESETEREKCYKPGPKKMIGFLQQEMFSRWQSLLQNAGALINPPILRNLCIGEQLGSGEAGSIKMHIELKPKPFQEAERRLKATQQIFFDSPWLTMIQLYSKLSGGFIKIFVVITLYTWVWGTILGLMLLIGSLEEEPMMIHGWIIFNILYSLLFFMIDDWIHSNINPCRSTVSMWLSITYSLYKPLATWVVLMQWSEMKKLLSNDMADTNTNNSSPQCLNTTTMKFVTPPSRSSSNSNNSLSSSSDTTKESTIIDLNITDIGSPSNEGEKESNTAAALALAVSTLRLGIHNLNTVPTSESQNQGTYEEYEDDGEDDDDYDEEDDDDEQSDEEEEERGESVTKTSKHEPSGESKNDVMMARGRSNGYVVKL